MKTKLGTSIADIDALHAAVEKTRRGTETVKVPRDALMRLLIDHSVLADLARDKIVDP